jgi:hypothetical protein
MCEILQTRSDVEPANGVAHGRLMSKAATNGFRLTVLLTILLFELVAIALLLPTDPLVQKRLNSGGVESAERQLKDLRGRMMASDPALGTGMPMLPSRDLNVRSKKGKGAEHRMLVIGSSCSSCSARDLDQWQLVQAQNNQVDVAILSQDSREGILEFLRNRKYTMAFFYRSGRNHIEEVQRGLDSKGVPARQNESITMATGSRDDRAT